MARPFSRHDIVESIMLLPGKNICRSCLIIVVLISSFLVTSRADDDGSLQLRIGFDLTGGKAGLRVVSLRTRNTGDEGHKISEAIHQGRADESVNKESGGDKENSSNNESDGAPAVKKSAEISEPKDKDDDEEDDDDDSESDTNRQARVTKGLVDSKEDKGRDAPKKVEADKMDTDAEDDGGRRRRRRKREAFLKPRKNKKVGNARKLLFAG